MVQNSRFLLIPQSRPANLASRVLGLAVKALPAAWEARLGKRPLLAETFVDPEGYKGTCYHAAGWTKLGQTKGYARVSAPQYYQDNERPKHLWVKPLFLPPACDHVCLYAPLALSRQSRQHRTFRPFLKKRPRG